MGSLINPNYASSLQARKGKQDFRQIKQSRKKMEIWSCKCYLHMCSINALFSKMFQSQLPALLRSTRSLIGTSVLSRSFAGRHKRRIRNCVTAFQSLSVSFCHYNLTRSPRFSIYKGKNALFWPSIIIYQILVPRALYQQIPSNPVQSFITL